MLIQAAPPIWPIVYYIGAQQFQINYIIISQSAKMLKMLKQQIESFLAPFVLCQGVHYGPEGQCTSTDPPVTIVKCVLVLT